MAEIATGAVFCLLTLSNLWQLAFIPGILLIVTAILLSLTDTHYLIVEPLIFYPMTLVISLSIWRFPTHFDLHVVDSLLVGLVLTLIAKLLPQKLGFGDVLLLSSWALFLGAYTINIVILIASLLALILALIRGPRHYSSPLPFVPFLTVAMVVALLWEFAPLFN